MTKTIPQNGKRKAKISNGNGNGHSNGNGNQNRGYNLRLTFKNASQKEAYQKIKSSIITILSGKAGTGKTLLAVHCALEEFLEGKYSKIILTRPVVEAAGEKLGFLPGLYEDKIKPYMVPLFEFLDDKLSAQETERYIRNGDFEVIPLAYMRGRNLNDSFIILDEGQNASKEQILMLLTRLGENSKIIITGDPEQSDLPKNHCIFNQIAESLSKIEGISSHFFTDADIIRHPLIGKILKVLENI
jgi:phosphate starvation-inducible PhoH-like protein